MEQGKYVTLRLLENECGFPPYYEERMETGFRILDAEFNSRNRAMLTNVKIDGDDLVEIKEKYDEMIADITQYNSTVSNEEMFAVFLMSREYIFQFQAQRNGMFAMAICHWVGEFIDTRFVGLIMPRDRCCYKNKSVLEFVNHVFVTSVIYSCRLFGGNRFFNLFYKISF